MVDGRRIEMSGKRPRVVIVGAGFGGLAAAKRLSGRSADVTLVDCRNHHLFQPLLYQVATAALSPADIAAPIRSIFSHARNIKVVLDQVTGVQTAANLVMLARNSCIEYDWLILATGARHSYFGKDEWARYAPGLKSIEDAIAIRRRVLLALEHAETESDPDRRRALLTFVVIGGGPTGIEMAGAIAELAQRTVSRDFRNITPHCSRVVLIEASPAILPTFPAILAGKAEQSLRELGVEIRTGTPVTDIGQQRIKVGKEQISAGTIIWAAGVQASAAAQWLNADHDRFGRVFVERDLRVPGFDNIFAIGDTANAPGADSRALPGIAPVAKQQGQYVAGRILGRRLPSFAYRDFGNLATIGRKRAVIDWGGWHLSGFAAWLVWSIAHIWFLIGFRSRIFVSLSWLWNYLTYQRNARLITGEAACDQPQRVARRAA
jgi:NADH dehydrogenase